MTPTKLASAVDVARPRPSVADDTLEVGSLELDVAAHRVFWHGVEVHLAPRNFEVLHYLMSAHPRVVSMHELASEFGFNENARDRGER